MQDIVNNELDTYLVIRWWSKIKYDNNEYLKNLNDDLFTKFTTI